MSLLCTLPHAAVNPVNSPSIGLLRDYFILALILVKNLLTEKQDKSLKSLKSVLLLMEKHILGQNYFFFVRRGEITATT